MTKSEKKRERLLVQALTRACETIKESVPGFAWLTHTAKQKNFPNSLKVYCVFSTRELMLKSKELGHHHAMIGLISHELHRVNVPLSQPERHVFFDNEQACDSEHKGNWDRRLSSCH